ncbi:hypothetical protein [Streptomyces murinus]|uniref:beta barrel domain-containing protein n=1 Tax=Streptomyces murinus TaxID=33900 RepID=UPI0018F5DE82|nr:hypothetical protein [Streptomyces murinus]
MPGLPAVKVGDPLILATGNKYRGDEPVTVSRIGRKYLYVCRENGAEYSGRFHLDGVEDSQYGAREHLYTQEQYDDLKQRNSLFEQLRKVGIEVQFRVRDDLATDQLRALLAVVEKGER